MVNEVPPQRLSRGLDLQLVCHVGQHVCHRDGLTIGVLRVDEVDNKPKDVTELAWSTGFMSLLIGVIAVILFVACHQVV